MSAIGQRWISRVVPYLACAGNMANEPLPWGKSFEVRAASGIQSCLSIKQDLPLVYGAQDLDCEPVAIRWWSGSIEAIV